MFGVLRFMRSLLLATPFMSEWTSLPRCRIGVVPSAAGLPVAPPSQLHLGTNLSTFSLAQRSESQASHQ